MREQAPVFSAAGREFRVGEVLAFAANSLHTASVRRAQPTTKSTPTAAALDEAVQAFRYRHNLISGEECRAWLAQRDISFAQLRASVARELEGSPAVGDDARQIDAILSPAFGDAARLFAAHAALAIEHGLPVPAAIDTALPAWRAADDAACAELLAPAARTRVLSQQRRELTRIEFELAEFDLLDAAEEARCCVHDDGEALAEVAAAHGFAQYCERRFWDQLPPAWAAHLQSVSTRSVTAVLADRGRFLLLSPISQTTPTLDCAETLARIDRSLVEPHFDALSARHVRWIMTLRAY